MHKRRKNHNYFVKHDFNWLTVIFLDKNDNSGVYVNTNMIIVGSKFEEDKYGDYSVISSEDEVMYYPNDDGTITKYDE